MVATILSRPSIWHLFWVKFQVWFAILRPKRLKMTVFYTNAQIGSVRSCSNGLKFGMNIGLYMGQIIG